MVVSFQPHYRNIYAEITYYVIELGYVSFQVHGSLEMEKRFSVAKISKRTKGLLT